MDGFQGSFCPTSIISLKSSAIFWPRNFQVNSICIENITVSNSISPSLAQMTSTTSSNSEHRNELKYLTLA
jgi:hypothetical protein